MRTKLAAAIAIALPGAVLVGFAVPALVSFVSVELNVNASRLIPLLLALSGMGALIFLLKEPVRIIFFILLLLMPVVTYRVPSGPLGLTAFDVGMLCIAAIIIISNSYKQRVPSHIYIFKSRSINFALLLLIPGVLLSQFFFRSLRAAIEFLLCYLFFVIAVAEIRRPGGSERLIKMLLIGALTISIGVFAESLGFRITFYGESNFNKAAGTRLSGFFQDPQKAGQFLACSSSFLTILAIRNYFQCRPVMLVTVWVTSFLTFLALLNTGARAALGSMIIVGVISLLLVSRWSLLLRVVVFTLIVGVASLAWMNWEDIRTGLLPADIAKRLADPYVVERDAAMRMRIWFDTWDMFENNPVTGIGWGAFGEYMRQTRPWLRYYFGMGQDVNTPYIPDQAENGYLTILYEGGILGVAAFLLFIGGLCFHAVRCIRSASASVRTEITAAVVGLFVFCGGFLTQFSLGDERIVQIVIILLALVFSRSFKEFGENRSNRSLRPIDLRWAKSTFGVK